MAENSLERLAEQGRGVREELEIGSKRDRVKESLNDDYATALSEFGVDLPDPDVGEAPDPLLDTRRGFFEQTAWYDEFDVRDD